MVSGIFLSELIERNGLPLILEGRVRYREMDHYIYEQVEETDRLPARFEPIKCPTMIIPAHWHEYLEIVYLQSGSMTAVIQAQEYTLIPGSLLIVNPSDLHMTRTEGLSSYLLLQISSKRLLTFFPDPDRIRFQTFISNAPGAEKQKPISDLFSCLDDMERIFREHDDGYELLFTARLYEFLYGLYRNFAVCQPAQASSSGGRDLQRVTWIMDWVKQHYAEPLTLDLAADSLALCREYFCRLFKKYTGQTFLEYVNDVRTMHLYQDLITSDDTIMNLMERNGLTNYKVFMRTFKKLYGDTPQRLRRSLSEDHTEPC